MNFRCFSVQKQPDRNYKIWPSNVPLNIKKGPEPPNNQPESISSTSQKHRRKKKREFF